MISMASQLQEQRDSMSKISHEANEGDLRQSDNQGSDVAAAVQPAAPEESSYMSSANRDSSISLANSSIIKSLLAELATVKASVTSKVEAVQSESKQVVEKAMQEMKVMERALETSQTEVERLKADAIADKAAVESFTVSSDADNQIKQKNGLPSPAARAGAGVGMSQQAGGGGGEAANDSASGNNTSALGDVNTWISFVRERSGTVDTDLSSYSLLSRHIERGGKQQEYQQKMLKRSEEQQEGEQQDASSGQLGVSLDSVEWRRLAPKPSDTSRPTLEDEANDRGVMMSLRQGAHKLAKELDNTLDDIYQMEVGNGVLGGGIPRTSAARNDRATTMATKINRNTSNSRSNSRSRAERRPSSSMSNSSRSSSKSSHSPTAPTIAVVTATEGEGEPKERTPRSKMKRLLQIQEQSWSPSSKTASAFSNTKPASFEKAVAAAKEKKTKRTQGAETRRKQESKRKDASEVLEGYNQNGGEVESTNNDAASTSVSFHLADEEDTVNFYDDSLFDLVETLDELENT